MFPFRADKMDIDEIAIERISVEDLRVDRSRVLIEQMASLAYRVFREPPWSDDCELARLHLGLGVDLMRRNAVALIAKTRGSGQITGTPGSVDRGHKRPFGIDGRPPSYPRARTRVRGRGASSG